MLAQAGIAVYDSLSEKNCCAGKALLHKLSCISFSPPPLGQGETATISRAGVRLYIVWLLYLCIAGTSSDEMVERVYIDLEYVAHGL